MSKHKPKYKRIAQLKTADDFLAYAGSVGAELPFRKEISLPGPLGQPYKFSPSASIGNRFCILPMEGWDGTTDGKPSDFTRRRWHHFAISGAKLLWGCEAVAVRHEGRANPNQLLLNDSNEDAFKILFESLMNDHQARYVSADDLLVGLQLTHSGRFSKPNNTTKPEPRIAHPALNIRFGLPMDYAVLTDEELDRIVDDFVTAAERAARAGFHFVDIKHCHGYLGHELLSAVDRPGKYGGGFENRTRFCRSIIEGIRASSGLACAVRLSAFDFIPYVKDADEQGVPEARERIGTFHPFGGDASGLGINLDEPFQFLRMLQSLGVRLICITAGSPYYNPHIQRPALFPPSDGYHPPEDPLVGVARQIKATAAIKQAFPELTIVGSAYSYLQEWLPNVACPVLENNMADFVGLGRLVLSYPNFADDVLNGRVLQRGNICRTFSDCTTAPRNGMISGCFPLDPYYKALPESIKLKTIKKED